MRLLEVSISLLGLIALASVLLVAAAVKCSFQVREARVTGVGRVLRRTKLGELPQLFNILAGDMSRAGPHEEQMLTRPDWEETYRREILPPKRQIELDYLSRRTLSKDVLILAQAVSALFTKATRPGAHRGSRCRS